MQYNKLFRKLYLPLMGMLCLLLTSCAGGYNNGYYNNGWGRNAVFVNNGWGYGHRNNVFVENNNWHNNMGYYHPGRRW
ncbi:MAG: hypothetical protein RIQ52_2075 [Pseudomonadota bacterium]|jgi:hypothetical protein